MRQGVGGCVLVEGGFCGEERGHSGVGLIMEGEGEDFRAYFLNFIRVFVWISVDGCACLYREWG